MKILLIADVHNKPNGDSKTLENIKNCISDTKPDLVVFLGDTVHGPDVNDGKYEQYLRQVLDTTGDTPFATVFGNHDDECDFTKQQILEITQAYPNCLTKGQDYVLDIQGETLVFIDSGSYYHDKKASLYDVVKPEQIDWAKEKIKGKKAIAFQHIIVPDVFDVISQSLMWSRGAVFGKGRWCKFKKGVAYTGTLGERPCPPDINTNQLNELAPNLKAMVFGHDHKNDFEVTVKGVKLIQCAGCGSNSYDADCPSSVKLLDTQTLRTTQIFL